ncbi:TIGR03089 family protein [uncultured Actinomyces sp.]|uniref:TIGR03089 family protein n=1 Tax=uncultured Actinomyces sp. TaxID=249061 RepID=UPI0028E39A81|nr:TIGR03089 family protein [uncultured Actinomyces sp.]
MQAISHFLSTSSQANYPILTHYHSFRDEISGPVASRWVSKMANLLASDLSNDLFGNTDTPSSILIELPAGWQATFWQVSADLMGWETRNTLFSQHLYSNAFSFDVHLSNELAPLEASTAAWRLAHSTAPLAMRWRGSLPSGILDALSELMAQSDQFEYETLDSAPSMTDYLSQIKVGEEDLLKEASAQGQPTRLGLYSESFPSAPLLTHLWMDGHSVVVVDKSHYTLEKSQEIFASEKVRLVVD